MKRYATDDINKLADNIEKGTKYAYPSLELRNGSSGETLFRCAIEVIRHWHGLEIRPLIKEWSPPIKEGFADTLAILNADDWHCLSSTPNDFSVITPECTDADESHRDDGWHLSPTQLISVYVVPIRIEVEE